MTRSRMALLLLAGTLVLTAAGCGGGDNESSATTAEEATTTASTETGASSAGSTIQGTVGPGFDISVSGADNLSPGKYTFVIDDKSSSHNFHLTGPGGIDVATDVGEEGKTTWDLDLVAGEYKFVCDPHASQMNGTFTVG
jgi:plastocyanin